MVKDRLLGHEQLGNKTCLLCPRLVPRFSHLWVSHRDEDNEVDDVVVVVTLRRRASVGGSANGCCRVPLKFRKRLLKGIRALSLDLNPIEIPFDREIFRRCHKTFAGLDLQNPATPVDGSRLGEPGEIRLRKVMVPSCRWHGRQMLRPITTNATFLQNLAQRSRSREEGRREGSSGALHCNGVQRLVAHAGPRRLRQLYANRLLRVAGVDARRVPPTRTRGGTPAASVNPSTGQLTKRGSRRNGIDRPNLRRPNAGWAGLST